jgi:hypothetical protein
MRLIYRQQIRNHKNDHHPTRITNPSAIHRPRPHPREGGDPASHLSPHLQNTPKQTRSTPTEATSRATGHGSRTAPRFTHPAAPNKPKRRRRPERNTVESNESHVPLALFSDLKSQISDTKSTATTLPSPAPNKPNLPTPKITLTQASRIFYRQTALRPDPENKPKQTQFTLTEVTPRATGHGPRVTNPPAKTTSPLTKPQQDRSIAIFTKDERTQL